MDINLSTSCPATPLIRRLYPERAGMFGGDTSPPLWLRAFVALIDHSSPHKGEIGTTAPANHRRWRLAERVVQFPPRPLWERIGSPGEARRPSGWANLVRGERRGGSVSRIVPAALATPSRYRP